MPTSTWNPRPQRFWNLSRTQADALGRVLFLAILLGLGAEPHAWASGLGQNLLYFARDYVIAPLGVVAVVAALGAAIFNPQFVRQAIYVALICAAMFLVISQFNALAAAIQN